MIVNEIKIKFKKRGYNYENKNNLYYRGSMGRYELQGIKKIFGEVVEKSERLKDLIREYDIDNIKVVAK